MNTVAFAICIPTWIRYQKPSFVSRDYNSESFKLTQRAAQSCLEHFVFLIVALSCIRISHRGVWALLIDAKTCTRGQGLVKFLAFSLGLFSDTVWGTNEGKPKSREPWRLKKNTDQLNIRTGSDRLARAAIVGWLPLSRSETCHEMRFCEISFLSLISYPSALLCENWQRPICLYQ